MASAQNSCRTGMISVDNRLSVTAAENRNNFKLFSPEEMENIKLNNLRQKRRELQEKLKNVSNRINFRRRKQEQELRKYIKSEEKSVVLIQSHNYKKFNDMLKEELEQRKQFETLKKAKQVQHMRITNNRKLSLVYNSVKQRKQQQGQKMRHTMKHELQNLKYSMQMNRSLKKQQCQNVNKMKQRQSTKKRVYWYEKRLAFQQKMMQQAQIYQKYIQNYYKKIEGLKETEQNLRKQELQAKEILKCAEQNFELLKQS